MKVCTVWGFFFDSLTVIRPVLRKVSAITRYPLYRMSATDKLDCRRIAKKFAVKLIRFGCICRAILIKWKIRQFGVWIWYRRLLTDNIIDFLIFSHTEIESEYFPDIVWILISTESKNRLLIKTNTSLNWVEDFNKHRFKYLKRTWSISWSVFLLAQEYFCSIWIFSH